MSAQGVSALVVGGFLLREGLSPGGCLLRCVSAPGGCVSAPGESAPGGRGVSAPLSALGGQCGISACTEADTPPCE